MAQTSETTSFTLDNMGRFLCNTLQEAIDSTKMSVAGRPRLFDVIVIGGGTFGAVMASRLFSSDPTHSRRILVLEAGPFAIPEHVQNMPYGNVVPDMRAPWDSHPALDYKGLLFAIGGRSLSWGGWSPEMLNAEFKNWPPATVAALQAEYFRQAGKHIGATDTNDFIYGRLHTALRRQLLEGLAAGAPHAVSLASLPDHPAVRYAGLNAAGDLAMGAGAGSGGGSTSSTGAASVSDAQLRELLGLRPDDKTPRAKLLNLLKLEAPLAVQSRSEPGLFPFNKFSAVPALIQAARTAVAEAGGIGPQADARKRLMIVPRVAVLDLITETQSDNWVRVTGVRVRNTDGAVREILLAPPVNGGQGAVVIALGTIESTRLALNTFKDSLAGRAAQRMGQNLVAHLRSNLSIRVPVTALAALPPSTQTSLQASALFVKGKVNVDGEDRFFHLQITASGLNKVGQDSESELFRKIPDTDQVDNMLKATDTHVVITLRGIGEMTPRNPDSFIRLSPATIDQGRPAAEVTLANIKAGASNTPQSQVDAQIWTAMDALADEVALIFAGGQPFEILTGKGSLPLAAGATAADVRTQHPYASRRDNLGTTHHDAGTLWMGDDPATSVTNDFGRIHDTTNCYVNAPALFPSLGSPNPMLTGVALTRRTAEMLRSNVLPRVAGGNASAAGFTALFDGTTATRAKWQLAAAANSSQGFAFVNGELVTYGTGGDFALVYYAAQTFGDFHLRLQFKVLNASGARNSGVFLRFRDPRARLPLSLLQSSQAAGASIDANPAWTAVISGFEVQIDDDAAAAPAVLRTGGIYNIAAGAQMYTAGPPTRADMWMQYDIAVAGQHYEVTLTDTETGAAQLTTVFDNADAGRGLPGLIGLQSYANSPVAFRDIWIK